MVVEEQSKALADTERIGQVVSEGFQGSEAQVEVDGAVAVAGTDRSGVVPVSGPAARQ